MPKFTIIFAAFALPIKSYLWAYVAAIDLNLKVLNFGIISHALAPGPYAAIFCRAFQFLVGVHEPSLVHGNMSYSNYHVRKPQIIFQLTFLQQLHPQTSRASIYQLTLESKSYALHQEH